MHKKPRTTEMPPPLSFNRLKRRSLGMTLAELIVSVSVFVVVAIGVCSSLVLSQRTFKSTQLDLSAYNLASDLCSQLQIEGYDALASREAAGRYQKKFDSFDKSTGSASAPLTSMETPSGTARPYLQLFKPGQNTGATNYVDVEADLFTGAVRGESVSEKSYAKTGVYRYAVRPEFATETVVDSVSGMTVKGVRIRVTVAYPSSGSDSSHRPVTVSTLVVAGVNAGSSYLSAQ